MNDWEKWLEGVAKELPIAARRYTGRLREKVDGETIADRAREAYDPFIRGEPIVLVNPRTVL